jgi:Ser/Thr protein kinase RdoA (MazF antagonist)
MQTAIMNHLNASGTTTSQPQLSTDNDIPVPASIQEVPVNSAAHSPCQLVLRLFSWVPGRTMDSIKMLPLESLADAGRFLGSLTQSLSKLEIDKLTAAKRYHQWDGKNTHDLKGFVQYIDDPKRKSMVESVIASFQNDLIESKAAERFPVSLIHADFNDANILMDENCRVSGIIDFGDSVERYVSLSTLREKLFGSFQKLEYPAFACSGSTD